MTLLTGQQKGSLVNKKFQVSKKIHFCKTNFYIYRNSINWLVKTSKVVVVVAVAVAVAVAVVVVVVVVVVVPSQARSR